MGARSCRGKEGKEKRNHLFRITSPTTHLGSWHPFPPARSSIVQHSELLPIRRSPLIGALAHFRRPPISPGCTWLRGHHEGSFRSGSLWGRSFITMLNCQAPVWCHASMPAIAPHPPMYLLQMLATRAARPCIPILGARYILPLETFMGAQSYTVASARALQYMRQCLEVSTMLRCSGPSPLGFCGGVEQDVPSPLSQRRHSWRPLRDFEHVRGSVDLPLWIRCADIRALNAL